MCGITGYWGRRGVESAIADQMARCIETRGPDDTGVWTDDAADIGLARRRLSILDLSSAGYQPMESPCGRYVLI